MDVDVRIESCGIEFCGTAAATVPGSFCRLQFWTKFPKKFARAFATVLLIGSGSILHFNIANLQ
jgi:hypothetical protein